MRTLGVLCLLFCLLSSTVAEASRRAIRVDGFGNWDLHDIPSPECPGTAAASTLVLWNGYVFSGRDTPAHLTDTYCQIPVPDSLTEASFFYPDETGLASLIGDNGANLVTAIRYAFLDRDRFDVDQPATGFQWTFYRFEAGDTDTTIVGLYGLGSVTLGSSSYIAFGPTRLWDASIDGYDGQYFCFANDRYIGVWDGSLAQPSACVTHARRVFHGSFE